MCWGRTYPAHYGPSTGGFNLLVVLFVLLVIIGCACFTTSGAE